jgi:hypothetical protein
MTSTTKYILHAVLWFVIGHVSCALLQHIHHMASK